MIPDNKSEFLYLGIFLKDSNILEFIVFGPL